MRALCRLGWRDLTRNRRFTLLFVLNLALGLTGLMLLSSSSASLSRYFSAHLQEMLTADLLLQSSRPMTEQERERSRDIIGPQATISDQISLYTMVQGQATARLAQIVAVDEAYPLYGGFVYPSPLTHAEVQAGLRDQPLLLMHQETQRAFGLAPGEVVRIGQSRFTAALRYDRAPGFEFTPFSLAPRIYMGLRQLQASGLIRFGSRVQYKQFIRLPPGSDSAQVAIRLGAVLAGGEGTPAIRVTTSLEVNRRLGRIAGHFRAFLGLAALVSLFLAGLSAAYLFREHLRAGLRETAILLSLGASHGQCLLLALGELALLGLLASGLAVSLAALLLPLVGQLLVGLIPPDLHLALDPLAVLAATGLGTAGSLLFCLPVTLRLFKVRPLQLLHGEGEQVPDQRAPWPLRLASLLPGVLLVLLLALRVSPSPLQGLGFTASLAGLLLFLAALGEGLCAACRRWFRTGPLTWRMALRNLHRHRLPVLAAFTALATALLLVNLVPQVEHGLVEEIAQPQGLERPDFFLVDIQEEQRQALAELLHGTTFVLSRPAPMVQGRIQSINGLSFAHWRTQRSGAQELEFQRTEFNFSSRDYLDPSETVVAGPPLSGAVWTPQAERPFEISLEQQFSQRLGLGIGDRMVLDIQGVVLEGRVVNLRKVRWNSFQPNFFILVQKGVLEEAPKTYLASVSRVGGAEREGLVKRLAAGFPNISVIDVRDTVERMTDTTQRLTRSLRFMAGLTLVTGLAAVASIVRREALRREGEINLLRVLGAEPGRLRGLVVLEFSLLGGAAALTASLLSQLGSWGLAWLLFDSLWRPAWGPTVVLLVAPVALCALIALLAANAVLRRPPRELLE